MRSDITIQRLSTGSVLKLVSIGFLFSFFPMTLLSGLISIFLGASFGTFNGVETSGFTGLLVSLFFCFFLVGFAIAFFGGCIVVGLWLFSFIRPITLTIKTNDPAV